MEKDAVTGYDNIMFAGAWVPNQQNTILFVLVDSSNNEVTGLGSTFTLEIAKGTGSFAASAGTKGEIGDGWYHYTSTAGEATPGPVAIKVTDAAIVQQNLEYVVQDRNIDAIEFTYTLTDSVSSDPIEGAEIWFATDVSGNNVAWEGTTDSFGVARDEDDNLPRLDPGTYYVFRQKAGYTFDDPDIEDVS